MKRQGVTDLRGAALSARLGVSEEEALAALAEVDDLPDDPWVAQADSPIERMFLAEMVNHQAYEELEPFPPYWSDKIRSFHDWNLTLQGEVGGYRVDLLFHHEASGHLVAVELDGHDYHERTKEQAARDRKKDRELWREGVKVVRFTGSEVYRDAKGCLDELIECLEGMARLIKHSMYMERWKEHREEIANGELAVIDAIAATRAEGAGITAATLRRLGRFDSENWWSERAHRSWEGVSNKWRWQNFYSVTEAAE